MNDMDLVAVRITQIRAEVAVAIMRTHPRRPFVRPALRKPARMGQAHRFLRRSQKSHHAAIAHRRRRAIVGHVDVEARQQRLTGHPAKRQGSAIRRNYAALQSKRKQHRIIKTARAFKITRPDSDMAEHLTTLHAPALMVRRFQKCMTCLNRIGHVTRMPDNLDRKILHSPGPVFPIRQRRRRFR
ncbi:hypothetical protein G6F65_018769 [Rhizopus arrhizus]|nr:hypothetical protein G6F65_018769 [Rhizopus arrhizus]